MDLQTIKTPAGTLMKDGEGHRIFFLCDKSITCKNPCDPECTHTLYLEKSRLKMAYPAMFEHEFTKYFERLYFNDTDYDWWEKEDQDNYWIVEDCKSFYSKIWDDYIWKYELRCPRCGEVVDTTSHTLWDVDVHICPGCHAWLKIKEDQK